MVKRKKKQNKIAAFIAAILIGTTILAGIMAISPVQFGGILGTEERIAYSTGSVWLDRSTFKSVLYFGEGVAQSFTPSKDATISKVVIPLKRSSGITSGYCRMRISTSLPHVASPSQSSDSNSVSISSIGTDYSYVTFTFPKDTHPVVVEEGKTYYLMITHGWTDGSLTVRGYRNPASGGGWSYYAQNGDWTRKELIRYEIYGVTTGGQNNAPSTPSLTGVSSIDTGISGSWTARSTDQDGDRIQYVWKVDGQTTRTSSFVTSGTSDTLRKSFSYPGSYTISVKAVDIEGLSSGTASKTVQVVQPATNHNPTTPTLSGASSLSFNEQGLWTARSTDQDGDSIRYVWKADGVTVSTSSYKTSGSSDSLNYAFTTEGQHIISVYAEDTAGSSSGTATKYITVGGGQTGDYTITVSVKNANTMAGISGATVTLNGYQGTTGTYGLYDVQVPAGTYTVSAEAEGYSSNSGIVTVTNQDVFIEILLSPGIVGNTITVKVYDESTSQPLSGVSVVIGTLSPQNTDDTGTAVFADAPDGTQVVSIVKSGYESEIKTITVPYAGTVDFYLAYGIPQPDVIEWETIGIAVAVIGIVIAGIVIFYFARKKMPGGTKK